MQLIVKSRSGRKLQLLATNCLVQVRKGAQRRLKLLTSQLPSAPSLPELHTLSVNSESYLFSAWMN
jgi:hypothetical protein